jgi:hypothetical protein
MDKNYLIDQTNAVSCEGYCIDLHNYYDFIKLDFEVETKSLFLSFILNSAYRITDQKVDNITLKFTNVNYFEISSEFVTHINHSLCEVGYKNPDDQDLDWLLDERESNDSDHIVFRFANDQYIRLHSLHSECHLEIKGK